jgi:hypothetical protein
MTPVDKRNFYLALSILEGQKIASTAGFSSPSEEVQESEIMDVIRKWLVLTTIGCFDNVKECADWMLDVVKTNNDLTESELENTKNVLVSFGMGLISHLIDSDILVLPNDTEELSMSSETAATFITLMTVIAEEDDLDE